MTNTAFQTSFRFALLSATASLAGASAALTDYDVDAGSVVETLAASADKKTAPEWIKIAPRGRVTTRDGRSYAFDPEKLATRFKDDDVKIPIDFSHGTARLATQGHDVAAIGWIETMEARDDGLYGHVDWLDAGRAALAARTHRYVSPTFPHDADGNAVWMHSVSLVTAPALSKMPALASAANPNDPEAETMMTKKLAAALGLADTADETAILSAIGNLKDGKVDGAVHTQTLATLTATKTELDGLKAANRKVAVDTLLDGALKEKRIVPAQRETYAKLCATDDGLTQVTALLAATPKGLAGSGLDGRAHEPDAKTAVDAAGLAAKVVVYQKEQEKAGNPIGYLDAFAIVAADHKLTGADTTNGDDTQ